MTHHKRTMRIVTKAMRYSTTYLCIFLIAVMFLATTLDHILFPLSSLYSNQTSQTQYWRIITANFVHFGWAHTFMNCAALLLTTMSLLSDLSIKKYLCLLWTCCLVVGLGIYWFNPEYQPYAGLSGAIHGLVVAGLIQTRAYPMWIKIAGLLLIMGKLLQENLSGYEATGLQQLIPAAIAVESHVYGAIAGAAFALGDELIQLIKRKS